MIRCVYGNNNECFRDNKTSEVKSMKKRRDPSEELDVMLNEDTEDEDYKMFKYRCYCQHIAKLLLTFFLGMLFRFLLGEL